MGRLDNYVYAETLCNWPLGYMEYYEHKYDVAAASYYRKYPVEASKIKKALYDARWHFARRIQNTHPYSIPKFVIDMKFKKFIKEIVEETLAKGKPVQLEFKFD